MILVGSYLTAWVIAWILNALSPFLQVLFKPLTALSPHFMPASTFFSAFAGSFAAVWVYVTLAEHSALVVTYLMLTLPAYYELWNDMRRVTLAKSGVSGTKRMLEMMGDIDSYDHRIDVRMEQASEVGHIVGCILGLALFVRDAPFFY